MPHTVRRLLPSFLMEGRASFPSGKEGMLMYITLAELFQYTLVIVGIIGLIISATKKK